MVHEDELDDLKDWLTKREAFLSWLRGQNQIICVILACRLAIRICPSLVAQISKDNASVEQLAAILSSMRALLTVLVSTVWPEATGQREIVRVLGIKAAIVDHPGDAAARASQLAALAAQAMDKGHTLILESPAEYVRDSIDLSPIENSVLAQVLMAERELLDAQREAGANSLRAFHTVPIWHFGPRSHQQDELWENWLASPLSNDRDWGFWTGWLQGLMEGRPLEWELQRRLAVEISDADWNAGVARVADRIREIEADYHADNNLKRPDSVPELDRQELIEHVKKLMQNPEFSALSAEGMAATIDQAIDRYCKDAPANCLPEPLEHLHELPNTFRAIAKVIRSNKEAEKKAEQLAAKIQELNSKVAVLEATLKEARGKTVAGLFTQSALKAAGTAFGAGCVGTLGLGLNHFFGTWPSDLTLENFRGWLSDLLSAEPVPTESPELPSSVDT